MNERFKVKLKTYDNAFRITIMDKTMDDIDVLDTFIDIYLDNSICLGTFIDATWITQSISLTELYIRIQQRFKDYPNICQEIYSQLNNLI